MAPRRSHPRREPKRDLFTENRRVTLVGLLVNSGLVFLKLFAGIFGRSQALVADAVHSISDLCTDAVVIFGLGMGRKGPDENHHFGHARIETLATAFVGLALIATAVYIGVKATANVYHHNEYHPTRLALLGAGLSIALKESLYHYTVRSGRRSGSSLIVANAWHHRSDALSSLAVLLGVTGALIRPEWHILDAYAAVLVSFFIIKVGLDIIRDSLTEIIDTAPPRTVLEQIETCAMGVSGVKGVHDLRVRSAGGRYQMETHIVVDGRLTVDEGHRIAKEVERCLLEDVLGLDTIIVHVDPEQKRHTGQ